jgi:hypothetical protein
MLGIKAIRITIMIACLGMVGAAQAELVGYWTFDEGAGTVANDGSGNGNHGTVVGDAQWVVGTLGGALAFDGVDDMVVVEQNYGLPIYNNGTDNAWSIAMWVKGAPQNDMRVFSEGSTTDTNPLFNLGTKNDGATGQLDVYIRPAGLEHTFSDAEPFDDTWHHIAWVDENGAARLYVDGVLDGGNFNYTRATLNLNTTTIGGILRANPSHWFTGMIDDVQIYNHALTEAEVLAAMEGLAPKQLAKNPTPNDEAIDVARDSELRWEAGEYAAEHDVYLGTSFEDVNDATTADAAYVGRQAETQYAPEALVLGTTYYWRIDEVNGAPDRTVFKGKTWSFEVEPVSFAVPIGAVTATASSATDGQDPNNIVNGSGLNENDEHANLQEAMWLSTDADATPVLMFEFAQVEKLEKIRVWNHNTQTESILGFGIKEALIEYSVDGENWSELGTVTLSQGTGSSDYAGDEVALDGIVAKVVRMTALSNFSILGLPQKGLSEVRFYAMPMRARLETPASGTAGVDPLVDLNWRAGREAARHEVLLGNAPDALVAVATLDDPTYTASLDLDSTVYWQVNEVNDVMDPAVWEGPVWEMATVAYLTVDDMESYRSQEGSFVWETWIDGFGDDTNGALLGHGGDDMETGIVYDGSQSLPFYYGNGGATDSFASRPVNRNWGEHGIVSLSLMFQGRSSNTPGEMYIEIDGAEIAVYPTPSDLTLSQWLAWTMDLPASALGDVQTLTIGIRGGTGMVLIDAVRLYAKNSEMISGVMPDDTALVGHWMFDEGSGTTAADSSGNNNHGTVMGDAFWVADGKVGGALSFDGVDDIVVVSQNSGLPIYNNGTDNAYSVALWVKGGPQNDLRVFSEGSTTSNNPLFNLGTHNSTSPTGQFATYIRPDTGTISNHPLSLAEPFDDTWHHITWVDDNGTATLYVDGLPDGGDFNYTRGTMALDTTSIGGILRAAPSNFFFGQIDEVRVYNRALADTEALGLAGRQDPIFKVFD